MDSQEDIDGLLNSSGWDSASDLEGGQQMWARLKAAATCHSRFDPVSQEEKAIVAEFKQVMEAHAEAGKKIWAHKLPQLCVAQSTAASPW